MEISFVTCALFIQCLLMLVNFSLSDSCVQISTCACNSSIGTIDLSPLSQSPQGKPSRFITQAGDDKENPNAVYLYNPCDPIKALCAGDDECAVCQQIIGDQSYSIGTQTSALMTGDPDKDTLMIVYNHLDRTSTVKIICDQSHEGVFKPAPGEGPTMQYTFELRTKYGCYSYPAPPNPEPDDNGISIGSVLVIIFFMLLVVYIVVGMLFLCYVRGAQDGIVFVFRGCKTDVTYTKI